MHFKKITLFFIFNVFLLCSSSLYADSLSQADHLAVLDYGGDIGDPFGELSSPHEPREDYCIPGVTNRNCVRPGQINGDDKNVSAEQQRICDGLKASCLNGCRNTRSGRETNRELNRKARNCIAVCRGNYEACLQ